MNTFKDDTLPFQNDPVTPCRFFFFQIIFFLIQSHVAADQPEVAIKHGVNENEVISSASLLKKLILRDGLLLLLTNVGRVPYFADAASLMYIFDV